MGKNKDVASRATGGAPSQITKAALQSFKPVRKAGSRGQTRLNRPRPKVRARSKTPEPRSEPIDGQQQRSKEVSNQDTLALTGVERTDCFPHLMATSPVYAFAVWQSKPMGEHKYIPLETSWERTFRGYAAQAFGLKALMLFPSLVQRDVMSDLDYAREFKYQHQKEWTQAPLPGRSVTLSREQESLSDLDSDDSAARWRTRRSLSPAQRIIVPTVGGLPLPADLSEDDLGRAYADARYPRNPAPESLRLAAQYRRWLENNPTEAARADRLGCNPLLLQWTEEEACREWNQFFVYSPFGTPPLDSLPFDGLRRQTWHVYGGFTNGNQEISKGPGPLPASVYGENAWEIDRINALGFWDLTLMLEIVWAGWEGPLSTTWVPCSALIPYCQAELAAFLSDNIGCPGFVVPNLHAPQLAHKQPQWAANIICWPKGSGSLLVGSHDTCELSAADPWGQVFVDQRELRPRWSYRPRTAHLR